ncbi:MAG: diacylglycerol/lipid kinase family protein, partial [Candidatus Kariarchaeaceae archaeon]
MSSSESRSVKIIFNPASRGGKSKKKLPKIEQLLKELEIDYQIFETTAPLDGITLGEDGKNEGFDVICSLGGDGTAHEVANGAIKANLPFAAIPLGSGNDFVGGLGLNGKWKDGIHNLVDGEVKEISILKANERYSINILDAGIGGDIAKASQKHLRWLTGSFKYTLLTIALLTKHKPYPVNLVVDGEKYDYNLNLIAAGFGQTFGSGMKVLPEARFNHSSMNVAIIHDLGRFKFLRIFPKVFSGKHVNYTDNVTMLTADRVIVEPKDTSSKVLRAEAEGELFNEGRL